VNNRLLVHQGRECPKAQVPRLRRDDRGGNLGTNVLIRWVNCQAPRAPSAERSARGAGQGTGGDDSGRAAAWPIALLMSLLRFSGALQNRRLPGLRHTDVYQPDRVREEVARRPRRMTYRRPV